MAKQPNPDRPAETGSKAVDRRARQAAALRENLRKRKQQTRARADAEANKPENTGAPDP